VALLECGLDRVPVVTVGDALNSRHCGAVRLNGEDAARLHAAAIEQHSARSAIRGVAPDYGADLS